MRHYLQNPLTLILTLALASGAILATAWGYEIFGGYTPCPLCLQERWAYYFTLIAGPAAFFAYRFSYYKLSLLILALITLAFLGNTGLGIYHSGIEWKFWPGPAECSGMGNLDTQGSLIDRLNTMRVIRCDEAPWRFLGISFAGYNALFSALLTAITTFALIQTKNILKKS